MNDLIYDASDISYNVESKSYNSIANSDSKIPELLNSSKLTYQGLNEPKIISNSETNVTPKMTSNTTPSPFTVTASSSYNSTYPPWKAFSHTNVDAYDSWVTANGQTTGWLTIDMGSKVKINTFKITSRNYSDSNQTSPKDFSLLGSNDGIEFATLKVVTNEVTWGMNMSKSYLLNEDVDYRYYKLNITAINGRSYVAIGLLEFLYKEVIERFRPIEKFDDFTIISPTDDNLLINAIKYDKQLILSNKDYKYDEELINTINQIKLACSGNLKVVFSTDTGSTWKSIYNNSIINLNCKIPNKDYTSQTLEEKALWSNAISEIELKGMDKNLLSIIDFNGMSFATIRFAFLLKSPTYKDKAMFQNISIIYDEKSHLLKATKQEYDTMLYDYGVKIRMLIDSPLVKVNTLLKEINKNNHEDTRILLDTPILSIRENGDLIEMSWNSIPNASYYNVYVNGKLVQTTSDLTYSHKLHHKQGLVLFCIRAYSNDTKYKPSNYSNMEALDYSGYLATLLDNGTKSYVAIIKDGVKYKFKVRK